MTEDFTKQKTVDFENGESKEESLAPIMYVSKLTEDFSDHYPQIIFEKHIGNGSFGSVFQGRAHYNCVDEVAIKLMKPDLLETKDPMHLKGIKRRFMNECVIQYDLSQDLGDKIVKVYDYGEFKNYRFMVMELMSDKNLSHIIIDHRSYFLKDRVSIMIDIAEILKSIHSKNIIHRDLTPKNCLFSRSTSIIDRNDGIKEITGERIIKLTDLGLIRWIQAHNHSEERSIIGTADYLSPEQVYDPTKVDERTDIFSFGVVFYELLNGEYPRKIDGDFSADRIKYVSKLVDTPVRNIIDLNETVSDLNDIVMKCMRRDPNDRYQSMEKLLVDLRDYYQRKFAA